MTLPSSFVMVQKHKGYNVLPNDHPCVCNTTPFFIDKYDSPLKIGNKLYFLDGRIILLETTKKKTLKIPEKSPLEVKGVEINEVSVPDDKPNVPEEKLNTVIPEGEIVNEKLKKEPKNRFTGDELLNLEDEEHSDLWEDYLPFHDLSIMAGKGGVGKTMLYLELALRIVTGKDIFLERHIRSIHKSVLIIATEDNERRLKSRIKKQLQKIDKEVKSLKDLIIVTDRYGSY